MIKIELYNPDKTYMFPNGAIATPEAVLGQFPAVNTFTHIIETDAAGETLWAVQNLAAMRSLLGVDPNLSEDEAIAAIEELRNAEPEQVPSAEDRIAAALEFQNLLSL